MWGDLRFRYKSIYTLKDTDDFDGAEFYGFRGDFEQNKATFQEQMGIEMGRSKEIIDTSGEDTKEWLEGEVMYDQLKGV